MITSALMTLIRSLKRKFYLVSDVETLKNNFFYINLSITFLLLIFNKCRHLLTLPLFIFDKNT